MDDVTFAVLGTGGIGRLALEASTYKEGLTPVAACDRNGVAFNPEGLDVEDLLEATEGSIAGDGAGDTQAADGAIELNDMERADDLLLERAGICDAEDVRVGGILDVWQGEKPTTTTVRVTGRTFDGERGTNTFQLDDNTSLSANVNGPALGYLKAGVRRNATEGYGMFGPAKLTPGF